MKRNDDYAARAARLQGLSDEALHARFWELAKALTDPLLQMGREYTSPSIERSVLLRMGFSSIEAKAIVDGCMERNLLAHGAGNVILRLSRTKGMEIRDAGLALCEGRLWDEACAAF